MTYDLPTIILDAQDYQPIGEVVSDYLNGDKGKDLIRDFFPNKDGKTKAQIVISKALKEFLKKAQKKDSGILIGRGNGRKRENIKLIVHFASADDEVEDDKDLVSEDESEAVTEREKEEIKKYLKGDRIGGVIGAIRQAQPEEVNIDGTVYRVSINLRIKCRMDSPDSYFFVHKLLSAGKMQIHKEYVNASEWEIFDYLLVDMFAERIRAAIPKGHYRTYRRFESNDDRFKGTIDVSRHIRENIGQDNGRIAYSFRENTVNNPFNALLLAAYKHMKDKHPDLVEQKIDSDNMISDYLKVLMYQVDTIGYSINKLAMDNARIISHPYYSEYEEVRKICLMILRDIGFSVFDDDDSEFNGFLYYLPDLWEEYLESIMKEALNRAELQLSLHAQKTYRYFEKVKPYTGNLYACCSRPDFVFSKDEKSEKPVFILDAKFKPSWERAIVGGNLASYCGDDINKCIRDMVVAGVRSTGVLFPINCTDDKKIGEYSYEEVIYRHISKLNSEASEQYFCVFPIMVPKVDKETYEVWEKNYEECLDLFKTNLIDRLKEKI